MTPEVDFSVGAVSVQSFAMTPTLAVELEVSESGGGRVESLDLDCQVRIETQRRRYRDSEQEALFELFGDPGMWSRTLSGLLWAQTRVRVPPFSGSTRVELPLPCSYDLSIATTKYCAAIEDGDIPLLLLFSGSIFYEDPRGELRIARVPWDKETRLRLPIARWQELIDLYYPNSGWLRIERDTLRRLDAYRRRGTLPSWEAALESLLELSDQAAAP